MKLNVYKSVTNNLSIVGNEANEKELNKDLINELLEFFADNIPTKVMRFSVVREPKNELGWFSIVYLIVIENSESRETYTPIADAYTDEINYAMIDEENKVLLYLNDLLEKFIISRGLK